MGEDEEIGGVFNFNSLYDAAGSNEFNRLKDIKIKLVIFNNMTISKNRRLDNLVLFELIKKIFCFYNPGEKT